MVQLQPGSVVDSYARQSRKRARKGDRNRDRNLSIEGQHAVNLSRIQELGCVLGETLQDVGKSAWDPKVKRENWERLLSRLESGASKGAVIFDIERLLRQVEDAVRIVKMAERGFKIIDSDGVYDLTTPQGRKNFYEAAVAAQYFSDRLSTRVNRGFGLKIADGEWFSGRHRMFGFEPDGFTPRESEAQHIEPAARALLSGREPGSVVGDWNALGLTTTESGPWTTNNFRDLMVNPRLAGYIQRRGKIVGRLKTKPLLDPTVWQEVVKFYGARAGRPRTAPALCSGTVGCGDCGTKISSEPHMKQKVPYYDDGTPKRRYICKRVNGGCGKTIADQRVLDEYVEALTIKRLSDPEHVEQIKRRAEQEAAARAPVVAEIARLEALQEYWDDRLLTGKITSERHAKMLEDVDDKLAEQREKLETMGEATPVPDEEALNDARRKWADADDGEKRQMLRRAFAGFRIVVDPGWVRDTDLQSRIRVEPAPGPRAV